MSFPIVPVALPVITFIALLLKKKPLTDDGDVKPPPDDKPIPVPPPLPPAPVVQTAVAMAPSGLNVRSAPNIRAAKLGKVPRLQRVSILEATTHPPNEGADYGWWKVQTAGGIVGYASAEYLFFGSDKEAAMSDEEFRRYNENRQDREKPIFQGVDFGACGCEPPPSIRGLEFGAKRVRGGYRAPAPAPTPAPPRMIRLPTAWYSSRLYAGRPRALFSGAYASPMMPRKR